MATKYILGLRGSNQVASSIGPYGDIGSISIFLGDAHLFSSREEALLCYYRTVCFSLDFGISPSPWGIFLVDENIVLKGVLL